jgi:hypothetical protein
MKTKISFDYDGNLNDHFDGGKNPHKKGVQKLFKELSEDDSVDLHLITRRYGPEQASKGLKNEHQNVFDLLDELKIVLPKEKILFTNREMKYKFILNLGINIHLDDDFRDRELIEKFTQGSAVDTTQPGWRKKFDELL